LQGASKNKFTGKEYDDEFGVNWYYFIGRPYDGQTGRWFIVDPGHNSLTPKDLVNVPDFLVSPYAYTLNNPVRYVDPSGYKTFNIGFGLFGQAIVPTGQAALGFTFDLKGNIGLNLTLSVGQGLGAGVGAGPYLQYTNAETIYQTAGGTSAFGIHNPLFGLEYNALQPSVGDWNTLPTAEGGTLSIPGTTGGGYYLQQEVSLVAGVHYKQAALVAKHVLLGSTFFVDEKGGLHIVTKKGELISTKIQFEWDWNLIRKAEDDDKN
jgi:RHS repeat-associated protein